jgi:hypothetical protein
MPNAEIVSHENHLSAGKNLSTREIVVISDANDPIWGE